jgi:hypothetical protein
MPGAPKVRICMVQRFGLRHSTMLVAAFVQGGGGGNMFAKNCLNHYLAGWSL